MGDELEVGTMAQSVPLAPTVGEISRRLGVPLHRVEYVIRSRNIRPTARAGNARLFTEADVCRIRSELIRISDEQGAFEPDVPLPGATT